VQVVVVQAELAAGRRELVAPGDDRLTQAEDALIGRPVGVAASSDMCPHGLESFPEASGHDRGPHVRNTERQQVAYVPGQRTLKVPVGAHSRLHRVGELGPGEVVSK
jgi:hypothetical protein